MDSATHDDELFKYVLAQQGSKKITLGTDYPFPLGDLEVGKFIEEMGLEKSIVDDIFCHSTLEWLKMDISELMI